MEFYVAPEPVAAAKKNPLFLVFAGLSAVPTALFLSMWALGSGSIVTNALFLWSAMWTWVWWEMAKRYR